MTALAVALLCSIAVADFPFRIERETDFIWLGKQPIVTRVTVENTSPSPRRNLRLTTEVESCIVRIEPPFVPELKPKQKITFKIELTPRPEAPPADYHMYLKLRDDGGVVPAGMMVVQIAPEPDSPEDEGFIEVGYVTFRVSRLGQFEDYIIYLVPVIAIIGFVIYRKVKWRRHTG